MIFEIYSNIKFSENPSSAAELFHADGQTYMSKPTVTFRSVANEPKEENHYSIE